MALKDVFLFAKVLLNCSSSLLGLWDLMGSGASPALFCSHLTAASFPFFCSKHPKACSQSLGGILSRMKWETCSLVWLQHLCCGYLQPERLKEHLFSSSSHCPSPAASCPRSKAVTLRLADAAQLMGSLQRVPQPSAGSSTAVSASTLSCYLWYISIRKDS